jgi:hypothetical protein
LTPGSGTQDPRWVKKIKNIPDHIFESLERIFWLKILKFFDADADPDPGSRNLFDPGSGIWDGKNSDPG